MARWFRVAALAFAVFAMTPALAQETTVVPEPRELPACDAPQPILFADLGVGIENLAFDGNGSLFVTAFSNGLYQAYPNGTSRFLLSVGRPDTPVVPPNEPDAFMGIDVGSDGVLYIAQGMSITAPVPARVLRIVGAGADGWSFETYAEGFDGANGLAVASDGTVYLAHGFRSEVWRITGPGEWAKWMDIPGANGLVEHPDGRLVFGQISDPAQGILAVNTTTGERETLFTFNPGPSLGGAIPTLGTEGPLMLKGIDDLVVLDDGRIVASAHLRKQFLLGDPATGDACILLDATRGEPTSARVAEGFGEWDGWVFLTDSSGDIHAVDLRPTTNVTSEPDADPTPPAQEQESPAFGVVAMLGAIGVAMITGRLRR